MQKQAETPFDAAALLALVGAKQDRAAFVQLFTHYAPRVKSYLLKHGAGDAAADEIVQNTFVTVWEKAKSFNPAKAAASTWIFTIARNKRIDALRRDRFVSFEEQLPPEDIVDTAEPDYADAQAVEKLNAALETLPEDQAKLVRMAFFEDKSHAAIADETQIPLGTVKSRVRLGLEKLRALMGAAKDGDAA